MKNKLAIMWARSAKSGEKFRVNGVDEQWFTVDRTEREAIRNAQTVFTKEGREFYFRRDCELTVDVIKSEPRNADGRTSREQAALERRARFAYDHDCD